MLLTFFEVTEDCNQLFCLASIILLSITVSFFLVIISVEIMVGRGIFSFELFNCFIDIAEVGVEDLIEVFGFVIGFLVVGLNCVAVVQLAFFFFFFKKKKKKKKIIFYYFEKKKKKKKKN